VIKTDQRSKLKPGKSYNEVSLHAAEKKFSKMYNKHSLGKFYRVVWGWQNMFSASKNRDILNLEKIIKRI
jgi:hypothetical protein